jgi:hypothetical protein
MTKMAAIAQDVPVVVKTFRVRVGVPELSVHNGPGGKETGKILRGNEVYDVLNVAGRDAWLEIAPGEWVLFQDGQRTNLTPIPLGG